MPLEIRSALQLALLLAALPAQYLITKYFGASDLQRDHQLRLALKTLIDYRNKYLSLESWHEWWSEVVESVRTRRPSPGHGRDVDNDESPAVEVLNYRSPEGFFASSAEVRSPRPAHVKFRVGQVVRHKRFGYRGVIIGWDAVAKAPGSWMKKAFAGFKSQLQHQPNYLILVDVRDRPKQMTTYVAQDNLEVLQRTVITHPQADDFFEAFDGFQYLPRTRLKVLYPHG